MAAKLTNYQKAVDAVTAAIDAGRIVRAYNVLDREETTAGPYREAVDRGRNFTVIGWRGRQPQCEFRTASEAAHSFIGRVGTTRAREAARK